jgi:hypothetical protein
MKKRQKERPRILSLVGGFVDHGWRRLLGLIDDWLKNTRTGVDASSF